MTIGSMAMKLGWAPPRRIPDAREPGLPPAEAGKGYVATWTIPAPGAGEAAPRAPLARIFMVMPGQPT